MINGRKHNSRCENSKKEACKCSCNGQLHGGRSRDLSKEIENMDEIRIDESFDGEVAKFIRKYRGTEYDCFGVHKSSSWQVRLHKATEFYAYPHDGGLEDGNGRKWWVFAKCSNPHQKGIEYETSFVHYPGAVDRAKREMEYREEMLAEAAMDDEKAREGEGWIY